MRLNHLIQQLSTEHREMMVLRDIEELSYREIAAIVGVPIGTVMSRLCRARRLLQERWARAQASEQRDRRLSHVTVASVASTSPSKITGP